jgi:inhibitor of KinA
VIHPLGDQAVLATLPDESTAVAWGQAVRGLAWVEDVVTAYTTVGVYFDACRISLSQVLQELAGFQPIFEQRETSAQVVSIPVCYERQLDLELVASVTGLSPDGVIATHLSQLYTVYAIGFVPGFPYLGYLPKALEGVPRLASPRLRVEPGSIGMTGRQTGIYPLLRPGGWNIIGRTPLTIVEPETGFFPLRVGMQIRFERIDEAEFTHLEGERLKFQ